MSRNTLFPSSQGWLLGFLFGIITILTLSSNVSCKNNQRFAYAEHARYKRQPFGGTPAQIDLNITVPFIFSARLYPYGQEHGDNVLPNNIPSQAFVLKHEIEYFETKYPVIYVSKDGALGLGVEVETREGRKDKFPKGQTLIAPYWAPAKMGKHGKVYFRETNDRNILQLAKSEVILQYRYSEYFRPQSVFIVTWDEMGPERSSNSIPVDERNKFQVAIIISNNGTFAHVVYSKLRWHDDAVAGFNEGNGNSYLNLPGSGTPQAIRLANESDIGIPGEWLFKVDDAQVRLCGPGFKGLECINKCEDGEWSYDCTRNCHCGNNAPCNIVNGHCPTRKCREGWKNPPVCDIDIDECEVQGPEALCPAAQPDCINTPGAYLCMCLTGYHNTTNRCLGLSPESESNRPPAERIPVVPISPRVNTPRLIIPNLRGTLPTRAPRPFRPRQENIQPVTPPPIEIVEDERPRNIFGGKQPLQVVTPRNVFRPSNGLTGSRGIQVVPISPVVVTPRGLPPGFNIARPTTTRPRDGGSFYTERNPLESFICKITCSPHATCHLTHGGASQCLCKDGYTGDGSTCVDVNECFTENPCQANAKCQNTEGGYSCLCEFGFLSQDDKCIDLDECARGEARCPGGDTSLCINTHGSYECRCKPGFNGNPGSILGCIDINECLIPEYYCGSTANCENTVGGFKCHCKTGYVRTQDGNGCEDLDECARAPCHDAAVCRNSVGSFKCECLQGYSGDGFECRETILFPYNKKEDPQLPRHRNSVVEVPLTRTITVFGNKYDRLYVSANGVVSMNEPLREYADLPLADMDMVAFSPLYMRTDLSLRGHVYFKETTDFGALTRGSLTVQEDFHEADFDAKTVIIVTYDDVVPYGSPRDLKGSTYQMVLTAGEKETFVTYIYEKLVPTEVEAGVVNGESGERVVLPLEGSVLAERSNIGQEGKWMFRVDGNNVVSCPSGFTQQPFCTQSCEPGFWGEQCAKVCRCGGGIPCDFQSGFCSNEECQPGFTGHNCQEDIDECTEEIHECHEAAICTNTIGAYNCTCREGLLGDGLECNALDPCVVGYGKRCSEFALCTKDAEEKPVCVCKEGFEGNGFECQPNPFDVSSVPEVSHTTRTVPVPVAEVTATPVPEPEVVPKEPVTLGAALPPFFSATRGTTTVTPFRAPTTTPSTTRRRTPRTTTRPTTASRPRTTPWRPRPPVETRPPFVDNRITPPSPTTPREVIPTKKTDVDGNEINNLLAGNKKVQEAGSSNMLVIIIPAVLCGIWLILILVFLVVCLRRRKQRQREKYGLGYYLPPTSSSSKSTGVPNGTSAASSSYGSWTIPRPNYDYYNNGAYYPDPYNQSQYSNNKY